MTGVNFAVLEGFVGADPEIRETRDGRPVAQFRLATGETWKDRATGERRERTEWHTVVVFSEGLCSVVERFVRKGSRVFVSGPIRTRSWEGQDGIKRWTTEIHLSGFNAQLVLCDRAGGAGKPPPATDPGDGYGPGHEPAAAGGGMTDADRRALDDEIPF